jgi:predicted RNase H-like HicB family nuclease
MAKSDREQRRTPKRITFDTREEALASLKKVLENGREVLQNAKSTIAKLDKPLKIDK